MTLQAATQALTQNLSVIYDPREAANISSWVIEHLTGYKKIDRVIKKNEELDNGKLTLLEKYTQELLLLKPVQYVLNEAWFCGMKLYVDENVLIPRPETEELVDWIVASKHPKLMNKLLDVGTGSGCSPIAVRKKMMSVWTYACDVSKKALDIAERNATAQETKIIPVHIDFLDKTKWENLPQFEIIASNPPYIPLKDKASMNANVVDYEPHLALFVQDEDPFIFYRAIAEFAQKKLYPTGAIFVEIHEELAKGVYEIFEAHGFTHIEVKKDMQGKDRMVKAETLSTSYRHPPAT